MYNAVLYIQLSCLIVAFCSSVNAARKNNINNVSNIKPSPRIINGTIISIEQAPYMVQLRYGWNENQTECGGTLISLQHILTAAHCVELLNEKEKAKIYIVAGASFKNETGIVRKIAEVFIHPNWSRQFGTDVAVVKLKEPFEESYKIKVQTKFCNTLPAVGEFVRVSGWGGKRSVSSGFLLKREDFSNELRQVFLPIITNDDCARRMFPGLSSLKDKEAVPLFAKALNRSVVCTYKEYYDACTYDSGGPAMYGDELCAIVAGGLGCAYGEYPGYFTRIPAVLDFIQEKLKA